MKTKFFQVATSGPTIDGREISAEHINQMAETYNPQVYGARISLDHLKSYNPESMFKCYGDVVALEARDVEIMGEKRRGLFAQFDVIDDLVDINKENQKVFTSIELYENFAKSGKAYCVGIACTDEPASLGTEKLQLFSQQKEHAIVSGALETAIDFEQKDTSTNEQTALFSGLMDAIKQLTNKFSADNTKGAAQEEIQALTEELKTFNKRLQDLPNAAEQITDAVEKSDQQFSTMQTKIDELEAQINAFKQVLDNTPAGGQQRPAATGGSGSQKTNC